MLPEIRLNQALSVTNSRRPRRHAALPLVMQKAYLACCPSLAEMEGRRRMREDRCEWYLH
jgi:hypothetical protein